MTFSSYRLSRSLIIQILALASFGMCSTTALGQIPIECPSISLNGPAGFIDAKEIATYSVTIDLTRATYKPTYEWTVSAGEIVSGQGTERIGVRQPDSSLTVTVKVIGLPPDCSSSASETSSGPHPPAQPIKIDTIRGLGLKDATERLHDFAEALNANPNNQGYIFIGHHPSASRQDMDARERKVVDTIIEYLDNRDSSRIKVVRQENASDLAEFWRVPPGANNPTCAECKAKPCPAITITHSDKPIAPGTVAVFSVDSDLKNRKGLKFEWNVNIGAVVDGQGTHSIHVRVPEQQMLQSIVVGVTVVGLPAGCKETTFTRAEPTPSVGDPIILDEFGALSAKEEMRRLNIVVDEWKRHPTFVLYFILRRAKNESLASEGARITRIKNHLIKKQKLPVDKVVTVSGGVGRRATQIYLVQP